MLDEPQRVHRVGLPAIRDGIRLQVRGGVDGRRRRRGKRPSGSGDGGRADDELVGVGLRKRGGELRGSGHRDRARLILVPQRVWERVQAHVDVVFGSSLGRFFEPTFDEDSRLLMYVSSMAL